ncbi:MAG: DUF3014 domain-containing protein [Porticoccaceae bacterium]|nr:DUF3014 domain-containing protein [Porticoccaceae bacterium]
MVVKKSGSSKFIIAMGSFVAVALILGVLYQTGSLSTQDDLEMMGIIPEQTIPEQTAKQPALQAPEVPVAEIPQPSTEPEVATKTEVEVEAEPKASPQPQPSAPSLPSLDTSDNLIRDLVISENSPANLATWLEPEDLIRRSASYIDGLARGSILGKIFALNAPEGKFTTHQQGDVIWLNAGNYERYNSTVAILMSLDMQQMAQTFHSIRPLLERAFAELGYKPRQMDGIILQTIDNILAAPVIVEPLQLTRESVTYKFADPELEALMPLQKQLLRAGPENTRRLQQQAKALREALLNP